PYGTTAFHSRSSSEISDKRYRYTGKEKDDETGLYYHGARYYIPWLGRWTCTDPAGFEDGLNPYAYPRNNPVRLADPRGTQSVEVQSGSERAAAPERPGPSEAEIRRYRNELLMARQNLEGIPLDVLEVIHERYGGVTGADIIKHTIDQFSIGA